MQISFIGAGKVSKALGMYFKLQGLNIGGYYSRTRSSAKEAADLTSSIVYNSIDELIYASDLLFITTNDDQLSIVDTIVAGSKYINEKHTVAHVSGAHSSDILKEIKKRGCGVCSMHPLQSFADPNIALKQLEKTVFTLEGNEKGLNIITELFEKIENKYYMIDKELKPIYHAGACIISNYLVTLMDIGFEFFKRAGIERDMIFDAVSPLIYSTLNNIKHKGTKKALTGPIIRGDEETLYQHIKSIKNHIPEQENFYKFFALKTIEMLNIDDSNLKYLFQGEMDNE